MYQKILKQPKKRTLIHEDPLKKQKIWVSITALLLVVFWFMPMFHIWRTGEKVVFSMDGQWELVWNNLVLGILNGLHVTMGVSFGAALVSCILGVILGVWAGYRGGRTEKVIVWLFDFVDSFPKFIVLIFSLMLIQSKTGSDNLLLVLLVWGLLIFPSVGQVMLEHIRDLRKEEFILGVRALGVKPRRIFWKHLVWDGCKNMIFIQFSYLFGWSIVIEACLSYLGINRNYETLGTVYKEVASKHFLGSLIPLSVLILLVFLLNWWGDVLTEKYAKHRDVV